MKRLAAVFWVVAICATAQVAEKPPTASEVWERAIAAKGGRERLHSIENVAGVGQRNGKLSSSSLTVLPDKYWRYSDMRPLVWGIRIIVGDESDHWYVSTADGASGTDAIRRPPDPIYLNGLLTLQAFTLLESRWHRPVIKGLDSERIGRREYWVVTAQVETHELLYYIDKETYLVRRIREPAGGA